MTKDERDVEHQLDVPAIPVLDDLGRMDGGYGWVVVISMTLINGFVWGMIASYGVYLSYYISHELFSASALAFTFIGGSNFAVAMLVSPFVNIVIRKYGTNPTMYFGCLLFAGGFIASSFAKQYWQLLLSQGILVGLGVGFTWLPAAPVVAQYFLRLRSFAQGIASAGSGVIGVTFSLAITPMIESIGLAWSLRVNGILSGAFLLVATFLMRDRNSTIRPKIRPFDAEILCRYQVLLLIGFTFFTIIGYIILLYSLSAFALSIGFTQRQGSMLVALVNAGSACARPFVGVLSDYFGRITTAFVLTVITVVLVFAFWIPVQSFAPLLVFSFIIGGTSGIFWAVISPLCAEIVPLKELPSTLSLMWLTVSMPSLFAEAIALEMRRPGSDRPYLYIQIFTGSVFFISSLFLLELRRVKVGLNCWEKHR